MRIKDAFVKTDLGTEVILVPVDEEAVKFKGVIRLNETAAFLADRLRKDCTEEELVSALLKEYDVERATAEKHVKAVLDSLRQTGALEE